MSVKPVAYPDDTHAECERRIADLEAENGRLRTELENQNQRAEKAKRQLADLRATISAEIVRLMRDR